MSDYLHLPSRAGRDTLAEIEHRTSSCRMGFGTPNLDKALTPMVGGDLVTVIARPGMGKTTFMIHMANHLNLSIKDGLIIYATWETSTAEFVALRLGMSIEKIARGDYDYKEARGLVASSISDNIGVFSRSGDKIPTIVELNKCLGTCQPRVLLVDYLQRIPGNYHQDRSMQISENLERLKDIALKYSIPVVVAVQAGRQVDNMDGMRFPGLNDAQWSSSVEQTSDKMISLTRPYSYLNTKEITIGGDVYKINSSTLALQVVKQRWAMSGHTLMFDINFKNMSLTDMVPETPVY